MSEELPIAFQQGRIGSDEYMLSAKDKLSSELSKEFWYSFDAMILKSEAEKTMQKLELEGKEIFSFCYITSWQS